MKCLIISIGLCMASVITLAATPTVSNVTAKQRDSGLSGLSVAYYDIASSGYSTWTQSEAAMTNYFAGLTPTLETNTGDWGDRLSSGMADYEDQKSQMLSVGMTGLDDEEACRFHGKYADETCDSFSVLIKGYLTIDIPGEYAFAVLADDKLVLYIDGSRVCSASWNSVAQGSLSLESGRHRIAMAFRESSGRQGFNVQWKKPGDASYSPLPQSVLSFEAPKVTASGTWLGYNATPSSWSASGNNALRGLTGVFSGTRYNESGRVSSSDPISRLTDGAVNPTGATYGNTFAIKSGTLTWTLTNAVDVYKLRINTHWENGGRDGVNLTSVEYQQSGDASWVTLPDSAISHGLNDNNTSGDLEFVYENSLRTVFATSVVAVRFNLGNQDNFGTGFTEFEIVGNTVLGNGGNSASGDIGNGDNQEPSNDGPEITNVTAKQRYPWNGKVDITYTLVGDVTKRGPVALSVMAEDRENNTNYVAKASALSGDIGMVEGTHHMVWNLNAQGIEFKSSNVVFTLTYVIPPYCIIDLSGGEYASRYPVAYMMELPSGGFNTGVYKTTKLVLRLIEPGSFMMCGQYKVTLTKPFYCGVFEVTQRQYSLVTGNNPSAYKGDIRPVEQVSWNIIRGHSDTYNWPSSQSVDPSTFVGKLQARTGLNFDLLTEAQWEYACRAGTTSAYNNGGDSEVDLGQLGRYDSNRSAGRGGYSDAHTTVGSYLPNAWGLYDMHGNVGEWCLDFSGSLTSGVTDPSGPSSGTSRMIRGGGCLDSPRECTSSRQLCHPPNVTWFNTGFRLARTISD